MNQKIYIMAIMLIVATLSCIKDDPDECIEPGTNIDETYLLLDFECINENYLFPDIVEDLELLFYDSDSRLVYDFQFTREELREMEWSVIFLEENGPTPGTYQIVALVNYIDEDHIKVTNKENQNDFMATIDRDAQNRINYKLKDTYHGTIDLEVKYEAQLVQKHIIHLSKNTNTVKLTVEFDNPNTLGRLVSYRSYISGNNGEYRWDNIVPPLNEPVFYPPYESTFGNNEPIIEDLIKIMRIWTPADINLNMEFVEGSIFYNQVLNIPQLLARVEQDGIYLYDTDEKLEHHDYFEITVRIGSEFVIASLMINGWFLIEGDIDI